MNILKGTLEKLCLWAILAVTVLYSIPPWRLYFLDGLGKHWDTKVMGYWMAWNAHNILLGNILIPRFDANFFYPHRLTLAFGEMLWPESFVYAAFWNFSHNLFLAFNGTMLFFWSLAGLCMYQLLREYDVQRAVAALAGFIYCLTPFMMAFYIEFNMTLIFIIPLLLLLAVRWLHNQTWNRTLGFCLVYFISITSCIYYTFMTAFPLLFLVVTHINAHRSLLRDKKFYLHSALIVAGILVISGIYLHPYIQLHTEGGYTRNMQDFMISHAQPLMYLDMRSSALLWHLFTPPRRWSETYLFPGSVLALLSILYWSQSSINIIRNHLSKITVATAVAVVKFILWAIFWLIILTNTYLRQLPIVQQLGPLLFPISLALLTLYLCSLFLPENDSPKKILLVGLAAGAVMCFFISLGPEITTGNDIHLIKLARGPLARLFESTSTFDAVRGLTRFAVIVLFYLIVASAFMLDRLVRAEKRLIWIVPVLIAILIFEGQHMKYRYKHYAGLVDSPVMEQARNLPFQSVLFQIPTTPKFIATNIVMNTIGDFHYLVNGMSGFLPKQFTELNNLLRSWKINAVTQRLRQIWPPVYLIIDLPATQWLATGWHKPFPWNQLHNDWKLMMQDRQYALYQLRSKKENNTRIIRYIRADVLKKKPLVTFSAHSTQSSAAAKRFRVLLNGQLVGQDSLSINWKKYTFMLPKKYMGQLDGDQVVLELPNNKLTPRIVPINPKWEVRGITFIPPQG